MGSDVWRLVLLMGDGTSKLRISSLAQHGIWHGTCWYRTPWDPTRPFSPLPLSNFHTLEVSWERVSGSVLSSPFILLFFIRAGGFVSGPGLGPRERDRNRKGVSCLLCSA